MTDRTEQQPIQADEEQFACHAARLLADNNCEDVVVLDLRGVSQITDFFVVATGTSERQLRSSAAHLKDLAKQEGQALHRVDGSSGMAWVVADFVNVMVHLFDTERRAYYDLESLWGDAVRVDWQSRTRPGQFTKLVSRGRE